MLPVPDPNYTVRADEQESPLNDPVEPVRPADGVRVLQLHLAADHTAGGVGEVEPLREIDGPLEGECVQAMREWTREWWEVAVLRDELVTSEPVLLELERTPEPKRSMSLALLASLPLLDAVAAVDEIVAAYLQHQLMPRDAAGDARHLALATFHGCAILATWNCRHIANANKQEHIRRVNSSLGFATPVLTTPFELLEQLP